MQQAARHSFSTVADTTGELVSMRGLDRIVTIDRAAMTVTVEGGIRYGELASALHAEGLALHNLPSLPHITVAGAVATATHGSGNGNGNLATAVRAIELVTGDGSLVRLDAGDPRFAGAVVNIGALGIVARLTLAIEPTFDVAQTLYEDLPLGLGLDGARADHGCRVQRQPVHRLPRRDVRPSVVERSRRTTSNEAPSAFWGGAGAPNNCCTRFRASHRSRAPSNSAFPARGTTGCRISGSASNRAAATSSRASSSWPATTAPTRCARSALGAQMAPLLKVSEVRTVAADDLWLSGSYGRDTLALHFTWIPDQPRVEAFLPTLEAALAPFDARPHWGKLTTMPSAAITARYPRWEDWVSLVDQFDPNHVFRNDYLQSLLT